MKEFGGPAIFLDRDDINTDEIIPAKYLTEITKTALKPYILEDLQLTGFNPDSPALRNAGVIVTRKNFGCGSSREHAVWVLEVNDINVVIAESFARIFRQNMFNCGLLAIELAGKDIDALSNLDGEVRITVDIDNGEITARSAAHKNGGELHLDFSLDPFDKELIMAGGWLAYANQKY